MPGDLGTPTGGYVYDRRILEGLAALGWRTRVHALDASFPRPTRGALEAACRTLGDIPAGRAVVVDGLALGGLGAVLEEQARRLRLVALVHHPLAAETGLAPNEQHALRHAEEASLAAVDRVVVTSHWTARALADYGVARRRIHVVEPGIERGGRDPLGRSTPPPAPLVDADPAASSFDSVSEAGQSGPPRDVTRGGAASPDRDPETGLLRARPIRLLCVATLTPRKGHALLLEALAALRDLPWRLDCVGSADRDPATAAHLRSRIERHDLAERVRLHGELPPAALTECYARADAFVLASYLEGYGMALADALVHGLPIVSTTAGAIPETVPAAAGLLVPPGDEEALRSALASLMGDEGLRGSLADGSRAAGARLPSWEDAAARFAAVLRYDGATQRPSS